MRRCSIVLLLAGALLVGCTAGDDTASEDTGGGDVATSIPVPSGPAPGVTDDAIHVGVEYVDLAAISEVASLDHGDYAEAYDILIDQINADGGIHGRMVEATAVGVNPVGTEPAEAACVQLTEDEEVFLIMGFFTGDAVLCPLEAHQTAVIGGDMTPERLARAEAPWFTAQSSTDLQSEAIRAMAEAGELDGTLGVFGAQAEATQMDDIVLPLLDELGVEVTESAVLDAPPEDLTATNAATAVVAERFEAAGIDQVLVIGTSGLAWATGTQSGDYRPQLLLTNPQSIAAYANDAAGNDVSVLDGAVAGNIYGPNQNIWELPEMQECIAVLEEAGHPVPEPDSVPTGSGDVFLSGLTACRDVALFRALVEAAGEDLDYGSLAAAADGLEVQLPDQPEPVTYGPPPSADGDLPAYLYDWDPDQAEFILREG